MTRGRSVLPPPGGAPIGIDQGPGPFYPQAMRLYDRLVDVPLGAAIYKVASNPKKPLTLSHARWTRGQGSLTLGEWLQTNTMADAVFASARGQLVVAQYHEGDVAGSQGTCINCSMQYRGWGPHRADPVWRCGHQTCRGCASDWATRCLPGRETCPICRAFVIRMNAWNPVPTVVVPAVV